MSKSHDKLDKFLDKHYVNGKGMPHTHTRIGDSSLGVSGGTYFIPENKYTEFYKLYVNKVFINKKQEYLTEKQPEIGPLLIDLDFRYSVDSSLIQNELGWAPKYNFNQGIEKTVDWYLKNLTWSNAILYKENHLNNQRQI